MDSEPRASQDTEEEWRVTFFPPLFDQRRTWILNVLRNEKVTSVFDVGCGEGQLLECLVRPAPWLPPRPQDAVRPNAHVYLHLHTVHGADISADDLAVSVDVTTPAPPASDLQIRWEDLTVQLWKGGLEVPNAAFEGIECIAAMEVIEHLPPAVLPSFAPVLLGRYHPRLLLLTTPSYTFNARFRPEGSTAPWGTPDPTQRTSRVFRHPDHKFEWTPEECAAYCEAAAEEWGYEVHLDGVGRALEPDPWGRDERCGFATQVALFRRREGDEHAARRGRRWEEWVRETRVEGLAHELLATQHFKALPSARKPAPPEQVKAELVRLLEEWGETRVCIRDFWREQSVSTLCGGWVEVLLDAIEEHDLLAMQRDDHLDVSDWEVSWLGEKWKGQAEGPWSTYRSTSPYDESASFGSAAPSLAHGWSQKADDTWEVSGGDPNMSWGMWDTAASDLDHTEPRSVPETDIDWGNHT